MSDLSLNKKNYFSYLNHIIRNKKVSHAYIIEIDDYDNDMKYVFDFIKMILCDSLYENLDSSNNIVHLIDENNYPDLKIIESDGNNIKKNQLLELQSEYSNKSLLDNKRIYVIKEAEKLNVASANTMLKFLEEPESDIIAILLTNNRYNVIETILSRCQVLSLKEFSCEYNIDSQLMELLECIINPKQFFIKYNYFVNEYFVDKYDAKEKFLIIESIIIDFLNFKYIGNSIDNEIITVLNEIDDKILLNSLSIIENELTRLEFNINFKLWIDSLFSKLILGGYKND